MAAIRPSAAQADADGRDDGGARRRSPCWVKAGEAFVRARANCRDCDCEGACRDCFLEGEGEPADFCPNEEFFAGLKRIADLPIRLTLTFRDSEASARSMSAASPFHFSARFWKVRSAATSGY